MSTVALRRDVLLLLAMCPALAVSDTVVNALGLGAAAFICAPIAAAAYLAIRRWLTPQTQLAAALLIASGVFACAELLLSAFFPALYTQIGLFVALFSVNAAVAGTLMRGDPPGVTARNVVLTSLAVAVVLLMLGAARELVGRGSILHGAGAAFGDLAQALETTVFSVDLGFLLGMLPTGAFIALGLLIAIFNWACNRAIFKWVPVRRNRPGRTHSARR